MKGSRFGVKESVVELGVHSPQLDVLATKAGVAGRERTSLPISGAPSEPLNEDPDAETHKYLVDTVWDRRRWNRDTVDP